MEFNHIIIICGYAEASKISLLAYESNFIFSNYKSAIIELALDLYIKFTDDRMYSASRNNKYCCKANLINNKAKFCCTCGNKLNNNIFDCNEFRNYLVSLHNLTTDSYGEEEYCSDRDLIWKPSSILSLIECPKQNIIVIPENAENVILDALLEIKPELYQGDEDSRYEFKSFPSAWENFKNNIPQPF